jgi:hypothetical protein
MARTPAIRFAFRISCGENAGLGIGQYRVWCHADDTYIADAGVTSWKVSLHGDVAWRMAETSESHRSDQTRLPRSTDRAPWKFTPTVFEDGQRLAFVVAATRGSLRRHDAPERYETIEVRDRWDVLTKANVWMTQPGVSVPASDLRVGPVLDLANGNRVWVTPGREPIEAITPEPPPTSGIVEPQVPEKDGVTAPGVILRGLNVRY